MIWSRCWRMADPRNELADIVVPLAPEMMAQAGSVSWRPWAAVLIGILIVALLVWQWHRRRFARALQTVAVAVARQQASPGELAARLDIWARARFRLTRLEVASCPQGLDPADWSDWINALAQLRFAPSPPDGFDTLAALCETAHRWKPHV